VSDPICLYVSSSPDLSIEREIVGEVVARLPLSIGWRIRHSPVPGSGARGEATDVAQCDLYVVLLGQDFAAPMGAELRQALSLGHMPLAYRKECAHSPAAQDALRSWDVRWCRFSDSAELRAQLYQHIARAVLDDATRLRLHLQDIENLAQLTKRSERSDSDLYQGRRSGEAGRNGVILGREVWEGRP